MNVHRQLAIAAMQWQSKSNDFMAQAGKPMPQPPVPGALPAMVREMIPAQQLLMRVDAVILWGIGEFGNALCSSYYDPASPWYNTFYGAYAFRSWKPDGAAWGYDPQGAPQFADVARIAEVDYDFLTAAQFGCPPKLMCFDVENAIVGKPNQGWDPIDVFARIPSGLHDPTAFPANPGNYVAFGVPDEGFYKGRQSYEPVEMRGEFFMRVLSQPTPQAPPLTLLWGAVCPNTNAGEQLLNAIIAAMGPSYFPLG